MALGMENLLLPSFGYRIFELRIPAAEAALL
jgi:hypothetical protein